MRLTTNDDLLAVHAKIDDITMIAYEQRSGTLVVGSPITHAGTSSANERFGWTFAPGDKVMQIENDYDKEVYNGDVGLIADVDPDAGEMVAHFDGRHRREMCSASVRCPSGIGHPPCRLDTILLSL